MVKSQKSFYHFDSLGTYNQKHAQIIADRISNTLFPLDNSFLLEVQTPRQKNSIDCGIHMLLTADIIISKIIIKKTDLTKKLFEKSLYQPTEADILSKRAHLALMIHKNQYLKMSKDTLSQLVLNKNYGVKNETPKKKKGCSVTAR